MKTALFMSAKNVILRLRIIATSELFYEAKALELIACLVDWHIQESLSPSVRSICDADREAIHRLIHFLQQHYCESLDVKNLSLIHISEPRD